MGAKRWMLAALLLLAWALLVGAFVLGIGLVFGPIGHGPAALVGLVLGAPVGPVIVNKVLL